MDKKGRLFHANHPGKQYKRILKALSSKHLRPLERMTDADLTDRLKRLATDLGFALAGVTPAVRPPGVERLDAWLEAGYAGEMAYLASRREAYEHPNHVLDGARSVMMLTLDYSTVEPQPAEPGQGRVSRYAWGEADYHDLIRPKLNQMADALREWRPGADARGVVDTAPLMERDFAVLAGLGWIGKNTLLLSKSRGSYFFLAAFVTDVELTADESHATDHCGTCTACLDACPTEAFVEAGVLDASRCLSYLTIEAKTLPPAELRESVGEWLFGCDVCQEVCPWNRQAKPTDETVLQPLDGMNPVDVFELFDLDDEGFRQRFRKTPLWRSKRRGLLRNAAMVLGSTKPLGAVGPLHKGLEDDEPLVRAASAWALGEVGGAPTAERLMQRLTIEAEAMVLAEINQAVQRITQRRAGIE